MMKSPWLRRGLVLLGAALLAFLVSRFPLDAIADACMRLGMWVFLTPILCMTWYGASSMALYHLLDGAVPWRALMWNRVVGESYNQLIPAAGVGGEPFKLKLLAEYVDVQRGIVALINDRLLENGIAFAFSATCVGIGAFVYDVPDTARTPMLLYAVGAWIAAIATVVIMVANVTSRVGTKIAKWVGGKDLGEHRLPLRIVARAFLWTAISRVLSLTEIALLFALLGVDWSVGTVAFTAGALSAAGFIGGVIPAGLGVDESASVGIFELLHFPGPVAIAFALARRGRMLVVSVGGALLHLAFESRRQVVLKRDEVVSGGVAPDQGVEILEPPAG